MNLKINRLNENELSKFVDLIHLFEDVFEMRNFSMPALEHLRSLLNRKNFYVFVAIVDSKVVGGLTAYSLEQCYSDKPLAYIYDLAINTNFQRKGIGRKLIEANIEFFKEKNFEEVFVQADRIDGYALDFYRSTKPNGEEDVIHFSYTLNK